MTDDTEIMSRYLQRGATMLGDHCDDCGNPLFRVQGDEVCVVCHANAAEAGRDDEAEAGADAGGDGATVEREGADTGGRDEAAASTGQPQDPGTALTDTGDAPVDEVRRNVLAVARRVSRDARDERELARLEQQLAVLERCAEVLDELG